MKKNFKLSLNGCLMMLAIFSVGMNQALHAIAEDKKIPCEAKNNRAPSADTKKDKFNFFAANHKSRWVKEK